MDAREKILEAAAELLAEAPVADVSTRAVCEAAGVGAPMLYRLFGDKAGLLAAVVDRGFERYLASKRAARPGDDPVADLKSGWDNHMRFALEHPNHYRLMYSPELTAPPAAAREAHDLLHGILERCAAAGRLTVPPVLATRIVMSANVGAALSMLTRPEQYPDAQFSDRLRDAVLDSLTRPAEGAAPVPENPVPVAAATLAARLRADVPPAFTPAESALLQQWLGKLTES
ncbi:TetR/AcrR family transcriptional regulator [Streptomyces resistomycificus]|uniref:TetR family transcriptional regulator n=1 Tax=Streptomyces resistomycificus TaxID=67356 RepID=A0A0L8L0B0_9ACTN|nr:TetR/AcrR family transcriptional regulator [Streptomyces resistomycificus]KOG31494.1 TetR family transcriptional regulator [Streptomyces resistomycificus]KUN94433.1 TetR family transcriptional regulator [Streptomyces resistomycificus]